MKNKVIGGSIVFYWFVVACLVLSSGCAGNVMKTTEKGLFHVGLGSKGQLLKEGRNEVEIHITDEKNMDVEGAKIEITPFMPEHGHGSRWPPTVTEKGKGLYRAVIPLTMSGHWELKIRIHKGQIEDGTVFDYPNVTG
ncbi:MAG: FixH family protein [Nitrospirae bacterium]|nr:FixH family protein [Nitrospirota bacterium]